MRKVYLNVHFMIIIQAEEDVEISEVMNELDYNFLSTTDNADIVDTEMLDYDIIDSK